MRTTSNLQAGNSLFTTGVSNGYYSVNQISSTGVSDEYYSVKQISEYSGLSVHKVRRIIKRLAETKPKEQVGKFRGEWKILHSLIYHFTDKPKKINYVMGLISPKACKDKDLLIAVIQFFSTHHPHKIQFVIETNPNFYENDNGYHLHFITEKSNNIEMKRFLLTLISAYVNIKDINSGDKIKVEKYLKKENPIQTVWNGKINE